MTKTTVALLLVAGLVLSGGFALAQKEFKYPAGKPVLSIAFPADWKATVDQQDKKEISAISKDEEIEMYLWALDEAEVKADSKAALEKAAKEAGKDIAEWVVNAAFKDPVAFEQNGIHFLGLEGSGKSKVDGKALDFSVTFFSPDEATIFALLYYGSPAAEKAHSQELEAIAKSIRKPR